ncbi:ribonuclease H-like domain-containing protein, partial [Tanacetum coccineum]
SCHLFGPVGSASDRSARLVGTTGSECFFRAVRFKYAGHETLLSNAFRIMNIQDSITSNWNMDTSVRSHLNGSIYSLSDVFNMCIYSSVSIGDDCMTHWVLLRCDSTGDLYPVTKPSTIPHAFLISQYTWHQRLGHPESEVLRRLLSNNLISCTKEKPPVLCHVC